MNPQQRDLLNKAQESLNAAKLLKNNNYFDYGVPSGLISFLVVVKILPYAAINNTCNLGNLMLCHPEQR